MQTFLPFKSFRKSAQILDDRRLGKQRVEALQIVKAITGQKRLDGKPYKGWINHPCSVMWRPYVNALKHYHNIMIAEWIKRGKNNSMPMFNDFNDIEKPHWLGKEEFHSSHRSNLLRKDKEYYSKFNWSEPLINEDPYVWLDDKGKWYEHIVKTGTREYI